MCSFKRLPYISKCCCYISLRISAYLIGFLQSLFGLAFMVYALTNHLTEKQTDDHDVDIADQNVKLYIIGSVFILLGVILVLGVKIKNAVLIKVYIVLEIIGLLVGLVIYVIVLIHLFLAFVIATADSDDTSSFVGDLIKIFAITTAQVLVVVIVIIFAIITLKAYFLLSVNSYLKELIKLRSGTPQAVGYTAVAEMDELNTKV